MRDRDESIIERTRPYVEQQQRDAERVGQMTMTATRGDTLQEETTWTRTVRTRLQTLWGSQLNAGYTWGLGDVQDNYDKQQRKETFNKYFKYFFDKAMKKHMVIYDINSVPDNAGINLTELFEYFEETNKLVWDSEKSKKPIIINVGEIQAEIVDVAKYKDMEKLADFIARKIIKENDLIPLQEHDG